MHCFIVGRPQVEPETATLIRLVQQLGHPASAATTLDGLTEMSAYREASQALVLLADPSSDDHVAEAALRFAEHEGGRTFVVYVAETVTPPRYKQLLRTHSADWIAWTALPGELSELFRTLDGTREMPGRSAKVVACVPSKGGVGNTLIASEVALQMASKRRRGGIRVALVDLNLQGGTLADALDVAPRFDIHEVLFNSERLDERLIDVFTSRHSPRLDVFAAPLRLFDDDAADPQVIFGFLDLIASRYDRIVLDLPNKWRSWTANLIQGSDAVVLSGGTTVPALKQILGRLTHLDGIAVAHEKLAVALNPCETDLLGRVLRRAEVGKALDGRRLFFVPRDAASVAGAQDSGQPLSEFAPSARVTKSLREIGDWAEGLTGRPSAFGAATAAVKVVA